MKKKKKEKNFDTYIWCLLIYVYACISQCTRITHAYMICMYIDTCAQVKLEGLYTFIHMYLHSCPFSSPLTQAFWFGFWQLVYLYNLTTIIFCTFFDVYIHCIFLSFKKKACLRENWIYYYKQVCNSVYVYLFDLVLPGFFNVKLFEIVDSRLCTRPFFLYSHPFFSSVIM